MSKVEEKDISEFEIRLKQKMDALKNLQKPNPLHVFNFYRVVDINVSGNNFTAENIFEGYHVYHRLSTFAGPMPTGRQFVGTYLYLIPKEEYRWTRFRSLTYDELYALVEILELRKEHRESKKVEK